MALLFVDGFDAYGQTPGNTVVGTGYRYSTPSTAGWTVRDGRVPGGYSVQVTGASRSLLTRNLGNLSTVVVGFAFKPTNSYNAVQIMSLWDGASQGVTLRHTVAGEFEIRRGTSAANTLGTTSGAAVSLDTWAYIELKVTTHATTGSFELRVNGVNVLSGTNVNTKGGSNNYITNAKLELSTGTANSYFFDDLYILDTSGSVNNDFLGSRKVVTVFPSAEGDNIDFTPSTGTDNSALVDENPANESDYVESGTTGHKDLYQYGNLGATGGINGVQVTTIAAVSDANPLTLKTLAKSGTTESADAGQSVSTTTFSAFSRILETNPDTSAAWTASEVDGAQFGIEVG